MLHSVMAHEPYSVAHLAYGNTNADTIIFREALDNLEEIVDAADGIMVARGDLGVEIDVAQTPMAQKRIIQVCKEKVKPVIVATQMLESMRHSSRPTRAGSDPTRSCRENAWAAPRLRRG